MECKKLDTREAPTEDVGGEYGKSKQLQVTALLKDVPVGTIALNQPGSGLGLSGAECTAMQRDATSEDIFPCRGRSRVQPESMS